MRSARLILALLFLPGVGLVSAAVAEEAPGPPPRKSFSEAFRTFALDGRYLMTFPARTNWKGVGLTAAFGAASALAMNRDSEIRDDVLNSGNINTGRAARK